MAAAESGVKAGRAIMSFIFAPVGVVTYFMIKDKRPNNAKAYLGIAIASVAIMVVSRVTYSLIKDDKK
jgi:hypothetical protein